jgi:hypothetical protein
MKHSPTAPACPDDKERSEAGTSAPQTGILDEPGVAPEDQQLHDVLMAVLDGICRCGVRGI